MEQVVAITSGGVQGHIGQGFEQPDQIREDDSNNDREIGLDDL